MKVNDGWATRLRTLEGSAQAYISFDPHMFSEDERRRLAPKMKMVQAAAEKLAMNMIKGTIKYDVDDRLQDEWMDFAIDDATDTLNYLHLMKDCIAMDKAVQLPLEFGS